MDAQIDNVLALIEELILAHGVFHAKLHFSSSRATVWLVDNPYVYQILNFDELSNPDICLAYRSHEYFEKAIVKPEVIPQVFQQFKALRFADETIYLRAASLNVVNGMVDNLNRLATEVSRVAQVAGTEGKLDERAKVEGVSGSWKDIVETLNNLIDSIATPVQEVIRIAVAKCPYLVPSKVIEYRYDKGNSCCDQNVELGKFHQHKEQPKINYCS